MQNMTPQQLRQLKSQCHHLKPVVWVGQHGLTENVLTEIEIALEHHELIKIKLNSSKQQRQNLTTQILEKTSSQLVQDIGNMLCLYRKSSKSD